jgi:hypothetical protein
MVATNGMNSLCVYVSEKCVPIHSRHQLLNCMDCVERDELLFVRIEKIH